MFGMGALKTQSAEAATVFCYKHNGGGWSAS